MTWKVICKTSCHEKFLVFYFANIYYLYCLSVILFDKIYIYLRASQLWYMQILESGDHEKSTITRKKCCLFIDMQIMSSSFFVVVMGHLKILGWNNWSSWSTWSRSQRGLWIFHLDTVHTKFLNQKRILQYWIFSFRTLLGIFDLTLLGHTSKKIIAW